MRHYVSTSETGINRQSMPFRLFEKAKKLGTWDPKDIDFSQDKKDWQSLTELQRDQTLQLIAFFYSAEEAVTHDILPLIYAISKKGHLEEEMYLTTFLFEEAKHIDFFNLLLENLGVKKDLNAYHTPVYRKLFDEILPETMGKLMKDQSPKAIADACIVYNMFAEGVLAETGYWAFCESLKKIDKMPGLLEGISYIKRDESRHIGFGTYLLQRLISEDSDMLDYILNKLQSLMPIAIEMNNTLRPDDVSAFGIRKEDGAAYMMRQLNARIGVLKRAKDKTIEEIYDTDVIFE